MSNTLDHVTEDANGALWTVPAPARELPAPAYPYSPCPCGNPHGGDPANCVCRHPGSNYPPV